MDDKRYGAVSMALHWIIAILIVVQLCLGWYMNEVLPDHTPAQAAVQTLPISVGLTILLLVLVRIGVRLAYPPPPLPAGIAPWERVLVRASHALFYILLLIMPLSGWALVSLGSRPIGFWGLPWPHMPGVGELSIVLGATVGAVLGFLWFNCYPAQVFMGDTGALPVGALLALAALASRQEALLVTH